mmetsp:Transcript_27472/g.45204  ORF Transcript_27472/g.45204 Transcript_27472/m.45204 type:complete len:121 (-) Transcript_27472:147-509(-)
MMMETQIEIAHNIEPMPLHCIHLRQLSVPIQTNDDGEHNKFEFTLHEKRTDTWHTSYVLRTASEFDRSLWIACIESKVMGLCEDDIDELELMTEKPMSGYQAVRSRPLLKNDKTASCLVM